ncbi:MAG: hypothetical protein HC927_01555 [Deltaproteobacteria bacterium]|nr:hypothetical protein [Deltaproteobacteria bacterium]
MSEQQTTRERYEQACEREAYGEPLSASEVELIGNYSYKNTRPYGEGFVCIGDAACFLDPVFSSGVTLALVGAEGVAEALVGALAEGREREPEVMAPVFERMERAYQSFGRFIHRFYNTNLIDNILLAGEHADLQFRRGVISMLAADIWREDNPFQNMLLSARRGGFG